MATLFTIVGIMVYIWFRFEWQFAVGAVIATMHDLLLTVGFFSITQLEFNTTSIAAILTIVGYSLNETVVVLDRIRENMRKYKKMSTAQMIDMSINAVLPRTLMTATTVFWFPCVTCQASLRCRDVFAHPRVSRANAGGACNPHRSEMQKE